MPPASPPEGQILSPLSNPSRSIFFVDLLSLAVDIDLLDRPNSMKH
jgi:hypothetical protein